MDTFTVGLCAAFMASFFIVRNALRQSHFWSKDEFFNAIAMWGIFAWGTGLIGYAVIVEDALRDSSFTETLLRSLDNSYTFLSLPGIVLGPAIISGHYPFFQSDTPPTGNSHSVSVLRRRADIALGFLLTAASVLRITTKFIFHD